MTSERTEKYGTIIIRSKIEFVDFMVRYIPAPMVADRYSVSIQSVYTWFRHLDACDIVVVRDPYHFYSERFRFLAADRVAFKNYHDMLKCPGNPYFNDSCYQRELASRLRPGRSKK